MELTPGGIFDEYREGVSFKSSLGNKGIYEQTKINRRFFIGDQWYGAKCGNDRPLVRHNVIRRIGDYKMSQILASPVFVSFSADGIPNTVGISPKIKKRRSEIAAADDFSFDGQADSDEINLVMSVLGSYFNVTAGRVGLDALNGRILKDAFVSGSSVLYTYWDDSISTGLYADDRHNLPINGDIACEVLDIEQVYFGDPFTKEVQSQPYIIIESIRSSDEVRREAERFGGDVSLIKEIKQNSETSKLKILTKLFKEYKKDGGYTIKCIKVCESAVVRPEFDTGLTLYPVSLFVWENSENSIYGESEVTYLIPNQIAINRMITAGVWAAMSMGMPMMVVNGDTVTESITNEPGQIIRIFGSNEDVSGAVKYVTPPDFSTNFGEGVNRLIENTLKQSGANEVALGDSQANNATALIAMRDSALMPLSLIKNRFYAFIKDLSRVWMDFFMNQYGNRRIKIEDDNGIWYMPFNSSRYSQLLVCADIQAEPSAVYNDNEKVELLTSMYEKGIITRRQYLKRLPSGIIPDINALIAEPDSETEDT